MAHIVLYFGRSRTKFLISHMTPCNDSFIKSLKLQDERIREVWKMKEEDNSFVVPEASLTSLA